MLLCWVGFAMLANAPISR